MLLLCKVKHSAFLLVQVLCNCSVGLNTPYGTSIPAMPNIFMNYTHPQLYHDNLQHFSCKHVFSVRVVNILVFVRSHQIWICSVCKEIPNWPSRTRVYCNMKNCIMRWLDLQVLSKCYDLILSAQKGQSLCDFALLNSKHKEFLAIRQAISLNKTFV